MGCLDCELMPWSAKAQELLRQQYAPTGSAARTALPQASAALENAAENVGELETLLAEYRFIRNGVAKCRRISPVLLDRAFC
jgi:protein phosphatase